MANEFLVSVADAILIDPNTDIALAYGTANITSALTITTQKTDVRGGINNPLLYTYIHDRTVEVKIEQATFDKTILGLNAGNLVANGSVSVLQTDCLVLSSGSGTLTKTPTGNATVFLPDGTITSVTPTAGSAIYVSTGANQRVNVVYKTMITSDQVTIETVKPPSVVDLILKAEVRDNTGVVTDYLQIEVPRFQISGNYTLSFAANGVSSQALDGYSLETSSTDCTTGNYYAKATWVPVSATATPVSSIAATPSTVTFSAADLPDTQQLTVLGIRGGMYANTNITSSCTYAKVSGSASLSISAGGLITAGSSGSSSDSAIFSILYYAATSGSITDYVTANIGA